MSWCFGTGSICFTLGGKTVIFSDDLHVPSASDGS